MSLSRWTGIVLICCTIGAADCGTFAGGTLRAGGGGTPIPRGDGGGAPPTTLTITQFDWSSGFGNIFTFEGKVTGGDGSPITIYFGNLPSLVGKSVTVGSDGSFLFTIQLTSDDYGLASAQAVNNNGSKSNVAYSYVFH